MTESIWVCAACGPHKGNSSMWCQAGCGSDYYAMIEYVPSNAIHRTLLAERATYRALVVTASRIADWWAGVAVPEGEEERLKAELTAVLADLESP